MSINQLRALVDRKEHYLIIAIVIIGFIIRSLAIFRSVGGDEASFLYYGWMIVKGKILYRDLFNQKPPGVYFITALMYLLFGKNILSIRILSAFLGIFTTLFIFRIGKKLSNTLTGIIAAILFESEPISLRYSTMAFSDTFMIFFMIIAVYFYIVAYEKNSNWRYLFVGILIGVSTIMRQLGVVLLFVIVLYHIFVKSNLKNRLQQIGLLTIGALISVVPLIIYFLAFNALSDALYSTILFNLSYSYGFPLLRRLNIFFYQVFLINAILWIAGIGGILFAFERRKKWDVFLLGWFIFSFLTVSALSTPYDHYYILGMPAICLLGGIFIERLIEVSEKMINGNSHNKSYSNIIQWLLISFILSGLMMYGVNVYLDTKYSHGLPYQIEAAEYIKTHTSSEEIIFSPNSVYYLLTDRENKYRIDQLAVGHIEAFGISDLPQYLETEHIKYIILDWHSENWAFNEETYRNFFADETRATEVKIVYEWILENYVLETTFGSGIDEIYVYHSRLWSITPP